MKKIISIIMLIASAVLLFASDGKVFERPSNVPDDATWGSTGGIYNDERLRDFSIAWHSNGNLYNLEYIPKNGKYKIWEYYHENGKLKKRMHRISKKDYLQDHHKNLGFNVSGKVGKQIEYHENGNKKTDLCYTFLIKKNSADSVPCGFEVHYDVNGKEIKRVEHKVKCDYGCEEAPRMSADEVIAKIRPYVKNRKAEKFKKLPVVGKIESIGFWSKNIKINYNEGWVLSAGDQIVCLTNDDLFFLECVDSKDGIGEYIFKEDKNKKL